jgi:REP element-mobilizing transposase RayT
VDFFIRKIYRDIAIESLKYCQLLAQNEQNDLSGFIRDFKNYTSKKFSGVILESNEGRSKWMQVMFAYHGKFKNKQTYQIWTHENHAEVVYSQKFVEQKINYIHQNPVRNELVANPEDYPCSSARNYAGME